MNTATDRQIEPTLPIETWKRERCLDPMPAGSVALHAPSHVFQSPGGGETQLIQTGRYLEARGVSTRLFNPWIDRLSEARLLHLFGMSREGLELARVAQARGIPVVVSPICWYEPRSLRALADTPRAAARALMAWAARRWIGLRHDWRCELLARASAILPNSRAEARQLVTLFGADPRRIRVVPNGVESRFGEANRDAFRAIHGGGEFVLFVGRIEPRKNVAGLIDAVRRAGLQLVVIGDVPAGREGYLHACRAAGEGFTHWYSGMCHDDERLASAHAAARVLALPSWFETPGLAALEGALAGSAVVVTPYGSTREYFGDMAVYARPDRPGELEQALRSAWETGPDARLALHVAQRFTWSEVARRTAEVYDEIAG